MNITEFSIIIPAFNADKTIGQCLWAIKEIEDFEECELIVADDASTDSTVEIAKKFKAKVVSNTFNKGVAANRNLGAKAAQGRILLFIDSDIAVSKNLVGCLKEDFKSSDICGVFGVYDEEIVFNDFFSAYKHLYMCFGKYTSTRFSPTADSAILAIPRKNFLEAGGFNEKYPGVMAEDVEFSIRFSSKENKPFLRDSRIKGVHYKKHNLRSLLKINCLRIKGIAKTIQRNDYKKVYLKMSKSSSGKSLFPMVLIIGFIILFLFYKFFLIGVLFSVLIFILVQIDFFRYLKKRKGIFFALSAVGFSFIEMFIASICALYFQVYYKFKK